MGQIPSDKPAITAHGLALLRGGRMLFTGVDVALSAGDALLLTGANGVGKSSLMRLFAGLLTPFDGTLTVSGRRAMSDENLALDANRPLADALGFWARIDGRGPGDVTDALSALDMAHLADIPVRMLSTGQRRRASLARLIASGADIWLMDEPLNGLDSNSAARIPPLIAAHRAAGGIAVVASHLPVDVPGAATLTLTPPVLVDDGEDA